MRVACRRSARTSQVLCVALAVAAPPGVAGAQEPAPMATEPVGRALDPAIPLAVPYAELPPPAAVPPRPADPREQYIAQRLQQQRPEPGINEDGGSMFTGRGLLIGGVAALFFGGLMLGGGLYRQIHYVPSGCVPEDKLLGWCPIERKGGGLITFGSVGLIAAAGMLTAGGLLLRRYRRATMAVQRTPRGTWTAGITLHF